MKIEKEHTVHDKSFEFALKVIKLCRCLQEDHREFVLSKQLLRSGTAIGALLREAVYAESKADFIHKHAIARKEANETLYWLELLSRTGFLDAKTSQHLQQQTTEILKLLTRIILTAKQNQHKA